MEDCFMKYYYFLILFIVLALGPETTRGIAGSTILQKYRGQICNNNRLLKNRPHSVSISEFGAVGDGITLNTLAFQNAIFYLKSFADKGGAQLYVPSGKWLTGSFNLTSHLTLFLEQDAIILGSQESSYWPVLEPLPSYGRGLEVARGRYSSLINGHGLTDVVITGNNGTIDGQGSAWWDSVRLHSLNYSRPHLVELSSSDNIIISNLTFLNAPSWGIHPVYCKDLQIYNVTILAPPNSPYTDGIVPDSTSNSCIEECYISVGHDAIALKSGWDEYGIKYGIPTSDVHIRRVFLQTPLASAIAFGSEMSGGIARIYVEDAHIRHSRTGIQIKTTSGRGGFIEDIFISNVEIDNVTTAFGFTGHFGTHPDDHFDPLAFPYVFRITLSNFVGKNVGVVGEFEGILQAPFTSICLSNISMSVVSESSDSWICSNVMGFSESVVPEPCPALQAHQSNSSAVCFSWSDLKNHHPYSS